MSGGLADLPQGFVKLDHIRPYFFGARWRPYRNGTGGIWNGQAASGLVTATVRQEIRWVRHFRRGDREANSALAVDADRHHGRGVAPETACRALRQPGAGRPAGAACPSGVARLSPRLTACGTRPRDLRRFILRPVAAAAAAAFDRAQPGFFTGDIVARHRHDALALGELDLEVHQVLLAERHFRTTPDRTPTSAQSARHRAERPLRAAP